MNFKWQNSLSTPLVVPFNSKKKYLEIFFQIWQSFIECGEFLTKEECVKVNILNKKTNQLSEFGEVEADSTPNHCFILKDFKNFEY